MVTGIRLCRLPLTYPAAFILAGGGVTYNQRQRQIQQYHSTFSSTHLFSPSYCCDGGTDKNRALSKDEFSKKIKEKVVIIRDKYKHTGCLDSKLMIWSVAGRPDTQSIELKLPSVGSDVVGVMAVWLSLLSQQGAVELHSQSDDGRGGKVVSFVAAAPEKKGTTGSHIEQETSGGVGMCI